MELAKRLLLTLVVVGALSACSVAPNITTNRSISYGQELMDLQKAKEAGAISEDEYAKAKQAILDAAEDYPHKIESKKK